MTFAATGKPAFGADTVAAVLQRILNDEPTIAAVPSPFREVIARCLDKDPHARPAAWDIVFQSLGHQDVEAASSAIELPEGVRGPDRLTVDGPSVAPCRRTPRVRTRTPVRTGPGWRPGDGRGHGRSSRPAPPSPSRAWRSSPSSCGRTPGPGAP